MIIRGQGFRIAQSKFDFFFGRVTSTPRNQQRSLSNRENLKLLGIDENTGGNERLLQIFAQGLNAPEIIEDRKITQYGLNIARKVEIITEERTGAIIVYYFYPQGNLETIPEVTSIIVLIYK